jgi:hypothetical protein
MNSITPIRIEWNTYNGFMFTILGIEWGRFEADLFGISWGWKSYFHVYVFFIMFEIKKPWYSK